MRLLSLIAPLVLLACGGGSDLRQYRGSSTSTAISGGNTSTSSVANDVIWVSQSGMDPTKWIFFGDRFEVSDTEVTGKLSGNALTFTGGQLSSSSTGSGTITSTLTSGSGTMTSADLMLTLTMNTTSSGSGTGSTVSLQFTGRRN